MKLEEAMRTAEDAVNESAALLEQCRTRGVVLVSEGELLVQLSRQFSCAALAIEARLKGIPEPKIG
jgi:hypothetical protein